MSIHKVLILAVAAMSVGAGAMAAPTRLNDAQYLAAARCSGLMAAPALGVGDGGSLSALLKAEGRGRMPVVADRAEQMRDDARREAGHAGAQGRAGLIAERDGVCRSLAGLSGSGATSGGGASSGTN